MASFSVSYENQGGTFGKTREEENKERRILRFLDIPKFFVQFDFEIVVKELV